MREVVFVIVACLFINGCVSTGADRVANIEKYLTQASNAASAVNTLVGDGSSPLSDADKAQIAGWNKWAQFGISMAATAIGAVK